MVHEIYIVDSGNELSKNLTDSFKRENDEYKFKTIKTSEIEIAK